MDPGSEGKETGNYRDHPPFSMCFLGILINLLQEVVERLKKRKRLAVELADRKSRASQMRMRSIANLASDTPTSKRRRKGQEGMSLGLTLERLLSNAIFYSKRILLALMTKTG